MPGHINYEFKYGVIPTHTKSSFFNYSILTVHSIIVKNALLLLHKLNHFPNLLPQSIKDTFPSNMPSLGATHETSELWYEIYGGPKYKDSIFYKGPLLFISPINTDTTTLSSLFSVNIYKNSVKQALLKQQSDGESDEWPTFTLHNIPGLRQSTRVRTQDNN